MNAFTAEGWEGGRRMKRDFIAHKDVSDGAAVLSAQADEERREISRYARNDVREAGKKRRRPTPFEMKVWWMDRPARLPPPVYV